MRKRVLYLSLYSSLEGQHGQRPTYDIRCRDYYLPNNAHNVCHIVSEGVDCASNGTMLKYKRHPQLFAALLPKNTQVNQHVLVVTDKYSKL